MKNRGGGVGRKWKQEIRFGLGGKGEEEGEGMGKWELMIWEWYKSLGGGGEEERWNRVWRYMDAKENERGDEGDGKLFGGLFVEYKEW